MFWHENLPSSAHLDNMPDMLPWTAAAVLWWVALLTPCNMTLLNVCKLATFNVSLGKLGVCVVCLCLIDLQASENHAGDTYCKLHPSHMLSLAVHLSPC